MVAPYWKDLYPVSPGSVLYRITRDRSILDETAAIILGSNFMFSDFEPELAVLVTWDQVYVYGSETTVS